MKLNEVEDEIIVEADGTRYSQSFLEECEEAYNDTEGWTTITEDVWAQVEKGINPWA